MSDIEADRNKTLQNGSLGRQGMSHQVFELKTPHFKNLVWRVLTSCFSRAHNNTHHSESVAIVAQVLDAVAFSTIKSRQGLHLLKDANGSDGGLQRCPHGKGVSTLTNTDK